MALPYTRLDGIPANFKKWLLLGGKISIIAGAILAAFVLILMLTSSKREYDGEDTFDPANSSPGIYLFDDWSHTAVHRFHPMLSRDKQVEPLNTTNSPKGRKQAAVVYCKGQVYLIGGVKYNSDENKASTQVDILNVKTSKWRKGPELNVARRNHAASVLHDGQILVCGGDKGDTDGHYTCEQISCTGSCKGRAKQMWTADITDRSYPKWKQLPNMPMGRQHHTMTMIRGQILICGGYDVESQQWTARCDMYNPREQSWTSLHPMDQIRQYPNVAQFRGRLFAFGSYITRTGEQSNRISEYNYATHVWTLTDFDVPIHGADTSVVWVPDYDHDYPISAEEDH